MFYNKKAYKKNPLTVKVCRQKYSISENGTVLAYIKARVILLSPFSGKRSTLSPKAAFFFFCLLEQHF
jgi:hypothetical protein